MLISRLLLTTGLLPVVHGRGAVIALGEGEGGERDKLEVHRGADTIA